MFDESVGVGETLGRAGAGFCGGGVVVGAAAPLVVVGPLVAVPLVGALPSAGASGAGATDIAAAASSKVATGGAWSGEWSGDAWTGSSPSDAWLGTGEAAGAAGVLSAGSDASLIALVLLQRSMLDRSCPSLDRAGLSAAFERFWSYFSAVRFPKLRAVSSIETAVHASHIELAHVIDRSCIIQA